MMKIPNFAWWIGIPALMFFGCDAIMPFVEGVPAAAQAAQEASGDGGLDMKTFLITWISTLASRQASEIKGGLKKLNGTGDP